MSIAGIFALGGGCYDNDKHEHKSYRRHKKHDDYSYSHYHRRHKCCDDDDDDDDGILGILGL